jgi:hypothetical protein
MILVIPAISVLLFIQLFMNHVIHPTKKAPEKIRGFDFSFD